MKVDHFAVLKLARRRKLAEAMSEMVCPSYQSEMTVAFEDKNVDHEEDVDKWYTLFFYMNTVTEDTWTIAVRNDGWVVKVIKI